jgi:hypothetical protein
MGERRVPVAGRRAAPAEPGGDAGKAVCAAAHAVGRGVCLRKDEGEDGEEGDEELHCCGLRWRVNMSGGCGMRGFI